MQKLLKYVLLYIITYFIVDFTTGFNWSVKYWLSLNGPLVMLILYPITGLLFYYLIYKKKLKEWKIFLATMAYAIFIEVLVLKNPLLTTFPAVIGGIVLAADFYGLIVFLPKWMVDKTASKHKKLLTVMIAIWAFIAIVSMFTKPGGA